MTMRRLTPAFLARPASAVAPDLIGCLLFVEGCGGTIVEVEAYERDDAASHSFRGPTRRNGTMFGPAGHAYVYRIYGLHWCLNVVCRRGDAVLIRALEPSAGVAEMKARRGVEDVRRLCAGPGRLCQALGVTGALDGAPLFHPPFDLRPAASAHQVQVSRRIGIRLAAERPWRFTSGGSRFLSRGG